MRAALDLIGLNIATTRATIASLQKNQESRRKSMVECEAELKANHNRLDELLAAQKLLKKGK